MLLSEYKTEFQDFSLKASDCARKLAFAGIALIWIFKIESSPVDKIPPKLLLPAGLLTASLFFDLLQYVLATIVWWLFYKYHESLLYREHGEEAVGMDPKLDACSFLTWPQWICFMLKLATVFFAYILIIKYIWDSWS